MNNIIKNISATLIILAICVATLTVSAANVDESSQVLTTTSVQTTAAVKKKSKVKKCEPYRLYVKHKKTKVRSKPNKKANVVKKFSVGKKVKVTAKSGNWRKVGKNKWVHKNHLSKKDPIPRYNGVKLQYSAKYNVTDNRLTRSKGVVHYKGHKETWYSQKVLPGGGLKIPGRHVADDGTIRDKDGYICIAANYVSRGSRMMTSLGPGKVYDCGSMTGQWIDIYTNW